MNSRDTCGEMRKKVLDKHLLVDRKLVGSSRLERREDMEIAGLRGRG